MNEYLVKSLFEKAQYYIDHEMWLHAVQIYHRLLNEDPEQVEVYIKLASVYSEMENHHAAEQILLKALGHDLNNPDILYALAMMFFRANNYTQAIATLEKLIPFRIPQVHYTLGMIFWKNGDLVSGERHLAITLELDPDFPNGVETLAEILINNHEGEKAVQLLRTLESKKTANWKRRFLQGAAHHLVQQWSSSFECLQEALVFQPDDVNTLCLAADALIQMKQLEEAEKMLLQARDRIPDSVEILISLGTISLLKSNKRKAQKFFNQALEIDPTNTEALDNLKFLSHHGQN